MQRLWTLKFQKTRSTFDISELLKKNKSRCFDFFFVLGHNLGNIFKRIFIVFTEPLCSKETNLQNISVNIVLFDPQPEGTNTTRQKTQVKKPLTVKIYHAVRKNVSENKRNW